MSYQQPLQYVQVYVQQQPMSEESGCTKAVGRGCGCLILVLGALALLILIL